MLEITTHSASQTKKIALALAREVFKSPPAKNAFVIALDGNLGAGKTTFVQGFAQGLGIKDILKSPTFVIMNIYPFEKFQITNHKSQTKSPPEADPPLAEKFQKRKNKKTRGHLVHMDCYRIKSPKELVHLGIKEIFKNPENIVVIEWAERIKKLIPCGVLWIRFRYGRQKHVRILQISN